MAKGIGLIGNFRGKVGNMVGYNLKDSNNKQTQGVRVYQPIVKNPRTFGQAEQRAKMAPLTYTYRLLKLIIDRGQEGKAYGNKSRLAWLSQAMKAFDGAWFNKGEEINVPSIVPISKGTLPISDMVTAGAGGVSYQFATAAQSAPTTIKTASEALIAGGSGIQNGDQITFICIAGGNNQFGLFTFSFIVDTTDTSALPSGLTATTSKLRFDTGESGACAGAVIVSREGSNGQHLRTCSRLYAGAQYPSSRLFAAAKTAAIHSYMASGSNVDWAEEYEEPVYTDPEP